MQGSGLLIVAAGAGAGLAIGAALGRRNGDMSGRVVLITGGSRGLGLSLAREFAAEGCRIAICARDAGELRAAQEDLERCGAEALAVECDVSDQNDVGRMVQRVVEHYGRVDMLVNNAGEIQVGPVESMTVDDFENAMRVMFWGTVYPTLELLPQLMDRPGARIVNITSIGGKVAVPHLLPYTCAKFAAVGFSEGLRAELAGRAAKVVTIAPGLMRTGSYYNAIFKGDADREAAWFSLGAALPGISMSAERAARQIVRATRRGRAERVLTTPANLLARFHGLFPGVTGDLMGVAAKYLLPSGQDQRAQRGRETRSLPSPLLSAATVLGRAAARRLLQPV